MRILHADLDAFFAAVEIVDNPKLKGKPVIVGAVHRRGVVATCNYKAREYGIHSAMPGFMAHKLCPEGIFLNGRMSRYKEMSKKVFEIFEEYSDEIEPLSIDEAYIDITKNEKSTKAIIQEIRWKVYQKTKLTISIGVSFNKFLAKIASDWNKPNGSRIILKEEMPEILFPLNIKNVYGLGKKSVSKLNKIGIFSVKDLYDLPLITINILLGVDQGTAIYNRIRGEDTRSVGRSVKRASIGTETTLDKDTKDINIIRKKLYSASESLIESIKKKNLSFKTVTIKYKTVDFVGHTKSKTVINYVETHESLKRIIDEMLLEIEFKQEIRLIGLTITNLFSNEYKQLSMFLENEKI